MRLAHASLVAMALVASGRAALAAPEPDAGSGDEPVPTFATPDAVAPALPATPPPVLDDDAAARLEEIETLQDDLAREQRRNLATREQVQSLLPLRSFLNVFIDVGAFSVGGNGSGIRSDIGHTYFPKYAGHVSGEWVFMGDPLATAINSLGEPADTSNSREDTSDTLRSGGKPSILVNSVGLAIGKDVGHGVAVASLVDLLPRPGHDILDVELAHVDWRPSTVEDLVLSAGKIDSVLGVEYRSQDAPRRLGVTPSLLCRYTCGRQLGVEARWIHGRLSTSGAITNGDLFQDRFEAHPTLKANSWPTASAHVQWMLPVGQGLELGVSGAYGVQEAQASSSLRQWHYGLDAHLRDLAGFDATAEFAQGRQPGADLDDVRCGAAPCLTYKAGYLLVDRRMTTWVIPYVRLDWRSAVHTNGVEFVYESHTLRATVGAHFEVTSRIVGKIEYTYNRELGATPEFPDDVLTTSLVVATD